MCEGMEAGLPAPITVRGSQLRGRWSWAGRTMGASRPQAAKPFPPQPFLLLPHLVLGGQLPSL